MLKIKQMVVNPCQERTYILSDESHEAVIIDCGAFYDNERRHLLEYIESEHLHPVHLLLTHAHHDHVYGNDLILTHFGLLPELHEADAELMQNVLPSRIQELYGNKFQHTIPMPDHFLHDKDIISFGSHQLEVISTPGHTPGSVVFYCKDENVAFTGDTLFSMSIGRTDLPGGSEEAMKASLQHLLATLPDNTTIYPGHGKESTIGHERICNPFL